MKLTSLMVLFGIAIAIAIGCAPPIKKDDKSSTFGFYIDSITDRTINLKKRFVVLPAQKGIGSNDLYFKEFSGEVSRTLVKLGYISAKETDKPDLVVLVSYGVGEPNSRTVTQTTSTSTTVVIPGTVFSPNSVAVKDGDAVSVTSTETTFAKYLVVQAVDWQSYKAAEHSPIWQTTIRSRGFNTDLREEMPLLVAGGLHYYGKDTGRQVYSQTRLANRDPLIRARCQTRSVGPAVGARAEFSYPQICSFSFVSLVDNFS